jgi:hypothetical protein
LCELEKADELLTKMNNKRKKKDKTNVFIGGMKLFNEMKKLIPESSRR